MVSTELVDVRGEENQGGYSHGGRPIRHKLSQALAPMAIGLGLLSHRQAALFKLAAKARRFFGPDAVTEIWREMEPCLRSEADRAGGRFEALAWTSLLLPTRDVCK